MNRSDVLVVGGGPAGTALAAELAALGLDVQQLAPHGPRPFPATYGAWLDELPASVQDGTQAVWTDVRVYTGAAPTPLLRPYALLDNAALLRRLRGRAEWRWTQGAALCAERAGDGGWAVQGTQGERWQTRLVVDASGHGALMQPLHFSGGPAPQTAYGVVARFARPPISPGSMSWMDYRTPAPELRRGEATFLYAMHLGGERYFVEETSLIARPAPSRAELRGRLLARLGAQGTPPLSIESEEWVAFPMNAAAPTPGPVLAYGAAAGRVHPVSGFQVAGALADAPRVARALADALAAGTDAAAAGWQALWPPDRHAARRVQLLGVEALLALRRDELPPFFGAFFGLPPADWSRFLAQDTPAEELARIMLRLFAQAPGRVRLRLMQAALGHPRLGAAALGAALRG
ncbi:lycopene cyclase family protein [Deinococcus lacus]|uniref:Lycopene cyclase family protein n=1 Tax=Deinococcus lacus TaxID=392561 RepID=A0ABW1YC32_9DEIO